jgi:hypothetical protein
LSGTQDDPTDIERVQLLVDTRMVDNQDDVHAFEASSDASESSLPEYDDE